jgi:hypothetical protein
MTRNRSESTGADPSGTSSSDTIAWLLLLSIFFATGNTLSYKAALNAFSSPTTNYGFFVSQLSVLVYVVQAFTFSVIIVIRDYSTFKELFKIPQSVYLYMGFLDSASGTLGAIAGKTYDQVFLQY